MPRKEGAPAPTPEQHHAALEQITDAAIDLDAMMGSIEQQQAGNLPSDDGHTSSR